MRPMDQKDCEFEGAKAWANSPDPLTCSSNRVDVEQTCLRAKGLARRALSRRLRDRDGAYGAAFIRRIRAMAFTTDRSRRGRLGRTDMRRG
jgi:hypothetical protein